MCLAGHGEDGVLEVGLQRQSYVGAVRERQVGADDRCVCRTGRGRAVDGAQDERGLEAGGRDEGQFGVVLEVRVGVAVSVGEGDPQLSTVQEAGVRLGALLGVADGPPRGHEAQFTRADRLQAARGIAVQHLALVQPADGLQSHVRVRRYLHAGLVGDVVGPVVIDEAPRADHAAAQVGQQAANFGGLAELDPAGTEEFTHRLGHHETAATAQCGNCLAIKIAHGAQPNPVEDRPSGHPLPLGLPSTPLEGHSAQNRCGSRTAVGGE